MKKKPQKNPKTFNCEKCNFSSSNKKDFRRHLSTRKHKMDNEDNRRITKNTPYECMVCGKQYKFQSGLSKHKKKCPPSSVDEVVEPDTSTMSHITVENESLKGEVKELRRMMQKMMKAQKSTNECVATLHEIIPKVGTTINNKMSINVFLNEKCKDAMNITDFVDKLTVSIEDLIYTKNHGYIKGISNIFVKQLQDMKPTERPIHCSDRKRLQFYIKDENKWEKDSSHKKIDKTIEDVAYSQIKQIKMWEKKHPDYLANEKLLMEWHEMIHNVMGGEEDEDRVKNRGSIKKEIGSTVDMKDDLINL